MDGASEVLLPRLMALPAEVAMWCMDKPRSAREVFVHINELLAKEGSPLEGAHVCLIKTWLMAAGQKEAGAGKNSAVALDAKLALSDDEAFYQWQETMLNSRLGQRMPAQVPTVTPVAPPQGGTQDETRRLAAMILTSQQQGQAAAQAMAKATPKTKDPYTKFEWARIMGYSGVSRVEDCSPIWAEFLQSKSAKDHRAMLMARMKLWADTRGGGITLRNVYLTNEHIKLITSADFQCGHGPSGTLVTAAKGITNIACLHLSHQKIAEIKQKEEDEDATAHTRTLTERAKQQGVCHYDPPDDWRSITVNTCRYTSLVWALFGDNSPLVEHLMDLFMVLNCEYCEENHKKFTGELARRICWAICEGAQEFFAQEMVPEDFRPGVTLRNWPTANLRVLAYEIKNFMPITRPSYPDQWQLLDVQEARRGNSAGYSGGAGVGAATGGYSGQQNSGWNGGQRPRTNTGGGNRNGGGSTTNRQYNPYDPQTQPNNNTDHVHPILAQCLKPYWDKHSSCVPVKQVLVAGNVSWDSMPFLHDLVSGGGRNSLCYNYLAGICGFGGNCTFNHVPAKEIEDGFAKEMVACMEPGLKILMSRSPSKRGAGGYQGGNGSRGSSGGWATMTGRGGGGGGQFNRNSPHFSKKRRGN
jgi:uncharacterized membrane protein YgcG